MKIRQVMLHNGFWQRQERLWKTDSDGMFVDGDEQRHVRFREAWEDFRLSEFRPM
jgi:predicted lipid-binding transport protein (Tim44 family)